MTQPRRIYAWREVLEDVRAFFDQVERSDVPIVIERHGRPAYVLNPIDEFAQGWMSGFGLSDEFARFALDELSREGQAEERYAETLTPPEHDWRQGGTPDPDYRPPRAH